MEQADIRILIVDDNALIRTATKMLLSTNQRFVLVGEAANGTTAIKMAGESRPDIILMDINMRPINGIETTRKILSIYPEIIVLGFSALPYPQQEKEMINAGAAEVINKSSSRNEIHDRIITVFEQRRVFRN